LNSVIFYNVQNIQAYDRINALRRTGSKSIEVTMDDTIVSDKELLDTVVYMRSIGLDDMRDKLMKFIENLRISMNEKFHLEDKWQRNNINLFEVSRYHILEKFLPWIRRIFIIEQLIKELRPDHLFWYSNPSSYLEYSYISGILSSYSNNTINIKYIGKYVSKLSYLELRKNILSPLRNIRNIYNRMLFLNIKNTYELDGHPLVFTEHYPNSVKSTYPVAKKIEDVFGVEIVWLATRKPVKAVLEKYGVKSYLLNDFFSLKSVIQGVITNKEKEVIDDFFSKSNQFSLGLGKSACIMSAILHNVLRESLESIIPYVNDYYSAFRIIKPKGIVSSTYSSIPGRAAVLAARMFGGKSIYLQHGLFPDHYVYSFFLNDLKLMWGEFECQSLVNYCVDNKTICVTGPTIYDDFIAQIKSNSEYHFPSPGKPLKVAYMASNSGGAYVNRAHAEEIALTIVDTIREIPDASLYIKKHPGDSTGILDKVADNSSHVILVENKVSQEVIVNSDIVIAVSSTTGYEAILANRPLIVFNYKEIVPFNHYVSTGAAVEVTNKKELLMTIRALQKDQSLREGLQKGRKQFIDHFINEGKGNAISTASNTIHNFVMN